MRRLAAALALVVLAACAPAPPPIVPPAPKVTPWVTVVRPVCLDEMGGRHFQYRVPAAGAWGWSYLVQGVWSPVQQVYPAQGGDYRQVVTGLPFRLAWYRKGPNGYELPVVASPTFDVVPALPC